ncbi:F-box/kelch-repeat protein [Rosa sericea]
MSTMEQGTRRDAQLFEFIPEEIMFEILTRLSVKSLLRFRCVCKSWNSLITSPNFINNHLERHDMDSSCDYLLVQTGSAKSLFCAKTFAKYMDLDFPSCEMYLGFNDFFVYGSCNGLLCICVNHGPLNSSMYIWNPSNRKIKRLPQGLYQYVGIKVSLGFGFHHQKNDYKVVKIVHGEIMYKVEVYSLRLNSWRELGAVLPIWSYSTYLNKSAIHVNGVVYWMVKEKNSARSFILSFDMDNEVFQKMELPEKLVGGIGSVSIQVFEKSLSLIHLREDEDNLVRHVSYCDIWVMGLETWKMIRTILLPQVRLYPAYGRMAWPLSFTTDGVYIVRLDEKEFQTLVLYDPISQEATAITRVKPGFYGYIYMEVHAYKETLTLLD